MTTTTTTIQRDLIDCVVSNVFSSRVGPCVDTNDAWLEFFLSPRRVVDSSTLDALTKYVHGLEKATTLVHDFHVRPLSSIEPSAIVANGAPIMGIRLYTKKEYGMIRKRLAMSAARRAATASMTTGLPDALRKRIGEYEKQIIENVSRMLFANIPVSAKNLRVDFEGEVLDSTSSSSSRSKRGRSSMSTIGIPTTCKYIFNLAVDVGVSVSYAELFAAVCTIRKDVGTDDVTYQIASRYDDDDDDDGDDEKEEEMENDDDDDQDEAETKSRLLIRFVVVVANTSDAGGGGGGGGGGAETTSMKKRSKT